MKSVVGVLARAGFSSAQLGENPFPSSLRIRFLAGWEGSCHPIPATWAPLHRVAYTWQLVPSDRAGKNQARQRTQMFL